jgi:serine/threonine-protein kinase HipA
MGKTGVETKYSSSYETLLKVVYAYTSNIKEVMKLYEYIVFNCLIGNGDAHLKNFSLTYNCFRDINTGKTKFSNIRLPPLYDVTNTIIYDTIDNQLALKIRSTKSCNSLDTGLTISAVEAIQIIERIAESILEYLESCPVVHEMPNLKNVLSKCVSVGATGRQTYKKTYNKDKPRKFE